MKHTYLLQTSKTTFALRCVPCSGRDLFWKGKPVKRFAVGWILWEGIWCTLVYWGSVESRKHGGKYGGKHGGKHVSQQGRTSKTNYNYIGSVALKKGGMLLNRGYHIQQWCIPLSYHDMWICVCVRVRRRCEVLYSGNHNLMRTIGFVTILMAAPRPLYGVDGCCPHCIPHYIPP